MHPDELTLPLWRLLGRAVIRLLTFAAATERWSHLSATERAERRARWPAWRRAVRPVGLAVFWLEVSCYVAFGERSGVLAAVAEAGWILLLLPIAVLSLRDWFREVPSKRVASPAGGSGAALRGPLPGSATEHPPA